MEAGLGQHAAACHILAGVEPGQPGRTYHAKPVIAHGSGGFGGIALVPPLFAQGVTDLIHAAQQLGFHVFPGIGLFTLTGFGGGNADAAHQHTGHFIADAPIIKIRAVILFDDLVQICHRYHPVTVGLPAQVAGHFRVIGPVAKHHFAVVGCHTTQDQPLGGQLLCAAMFHLDIQPFLCSSYAWLCSRYRRTKPIKICHSLYSWAR